MKDPLIDVRWRRVGKWAGDEGGENECRGLTLRQFAARLARVTRRGDIIQLLSVAIRHDGARAANLQRFKNGTAQPTKKIL